MEGLGARHCLREVRGKSMSKIGTIILGIILLSTAGGYLYWMHGHGSPGRISSDSSVASVRAATAQPAEPASSKDANPSVVEKKNSLAAADSKVALRPGEVLDFVADVSKLSNVANLRLQIVEQRNFFGKNAWHLQALAHTENPLRMVFELDDQFDSYSESTSFSTLQYEMHLNERGQKIESVQRMTTTGVAAPAAGNATQTHVLAGTRDPLGLMQFLRTIDWSRTPQVRGPVYDGHKLYDVRSEYQGKASGIAVPAGTFSTSKVEIHVYDSGAELRDAHFVLYLADNPARTPVLLEAVMPFATARVALSNMR